MSFFSERRAGAWMETVGAYTAVLIVTAYVLIAVAPYIGWEAHGDTAVIAQHDNTLQNVFIAIVSFFFGASVGGRKKDDAISTMAAVAVVDGVSKSTPTPSPVPTNI